MLAFLIYSICALRKQTQMGAGRWNESAGLSIIKFNLVYFTAHTFLLLRVSQTIFIHPILCLFVSSLQLGQLWQNQWTSWWSPIQSLTLSKLLSSHKIRCIQHYIHTKKSSIGNLSQCVRTVEPAYMVKRLVGSGMKTLKAEMKIIPYRQ
jgi:hypothetical protein